MADGVVKHHFDTSGLRFEFLVCVKVQGSLFLPLFILFVLPTPRGDFVGSVHGKLTIRA